MSCSKEDIERKRLAALQKRQNKLLNENSSSPYKENNTVSDNKFIHTSKSFYSPVKHVHNTKPYHPYLKPENFASTSINHNKVLVTKVVSGTVYLISENRFEVNPSEFCPPLIDVFKSIASKNYDPKSKLWNFSIEDYDEFLSKVAPLSPHIVLGPLPPYVLKALRDEVMNINNVDMSPIEATLRNQLMPFQEEGVRFGIAGRGRCMIADDMGLGKTFQALAIASYYREDWPLLVLTTSSMRETWQSKIHELLPSVPMMNIVCLTSGRDAELVADRQTEVVIVSYKICTMHTDLLKRKKFGVIIIDESHYLKSHKAQCTTALAHISKQARRVILLSGTPALSRPAELFTQLSLIEPRFFTSYTEYGKRYCAGKQTKFGWDMTGQSHLQELQILLQRRFLIRRTKDQVLTSLRAKTRETVLLDSSLLQFSKEEVADFSQMAMACRTSRANEKHSALITFFSESAKVKIPAICKYIRQVLSEESGKLLIFAHHKCVIDAICLCLDEAATHYISIVGSTPACTRADLVDKFQHVAGCRAAVLSITAAHSGLTLTAATLVVFAELHWNPGMLTQAESRAHRIGQAGGVCARYLLAAGTADDLMWPLLRHKLNVLNDVGLSVDTFDDNATKHQESKTNITRYLSPSSMKNKNEYIPGTNIPKYQQNNEKLNSNCDVSGSNNSNSVIDSDKRDTSCHKVSDVLNKESSATDCNLNDFLDERFFENDDDDMLLATLDF